MSTGQTITVAKLFPQFARGRALVSEAGARFRAGWTGASVTGSQSSRTHPPTQSQDKLKHRDTHLLPSLAQVCDVEGFVTDMHWFPVGSKKQATTAAAAADIFAAACADGERGGPVTTPRVTIGTIVARPPPKMISRLKNLGTSFEEARS